MFNPALRTAKLKTACKLCNSRIKLLKNKRTIQVDQMCKEISGLLASDKRDYAWIRVEAILREKNLLYAYEILELYLELIAVRAQLLDKSKECPKDMVEAITSLLYASSRVPDLPELIDVRKILNYKYGKELGQEGTSKNKINYSDNIPENWQVNHNLRRFLAIEAPEPEEKLTQLSEIAEKFKVDFDIEEYSQCSMVQNDPKYEMASVHIKNHVYTSNGNEDGYPPVSYVPPPPAASSSSSPSPYKPIYGVAIGSSAVPEPDSFPTVQPIEKTSSGMNPLNYPSLNNVPKPTQINMQFNNSNLNQNFSQENNNGYSGMGGGHSSYVSPPPPPPFSTPNTNTYHIKKDSDVSIQEKYDAAQGPPVKKNSVIDNGNELPSAPTESMELPPPPTTTAQNKSTDKDIDLSELNKRLAELRKRD